MSSKRSSHSAFAPSLEQNPHTSKRQRLDNNSAFSTSRSASPNDKGPSTPYSVFNSDVSIVSNPPPSIPSALTSLSLYFQSRAQALIPLISIPPSNPSSLKKHESLLSQYNFLIQESDRCARKAVEFCEKEIGHRSEKVELEAKVRLSEVRLAQGKDIGEGSRLVSRRKCYIKGWSIG
jgi:hypothetical protein